jgi:peptide chain release factor 3
MDLELPQVGRRRTFAIISHPDAGKTTLTEKLLLYGGAIQLAGTVKARGERRRARSDWMRVEQERGISVTASAMTYQYDGHTFNLLDTPGHQDFSEDTYRTLTAVDSAVMVLDAAKGIESQTLKLFEVCRLRDVPIITFINKIDRDSRDPFDLLGEIEQLLALEVAPVTWPVGTGRECLGCYDLAHHELLLLDRADRHVAARGLTLGLDHPELGRHLPAAAVDNLRAQIDLARGLCHEFELDAYRHGYLTPVFFGSALHSFGVRELLRGLVEYSPSPRPQAARERSVQPEETAATGFVFKIQANMDPKHRDRIAFVRVCSGRFRRGMKLLHVRTGKTLILHNPVLFFAQDRELVEEAWPGDIIGVPNHGNLQIGDTLSEGEVLHFSGIPSFAPELLQRVRPADPMRAKHLSRALEQLAEEGVARVFRTHAGSSYIVGVVGALQFDVLADRIRGEYELPVHFEPASLLTARWVAAESATALREFSEGNQGSMAVDHTGAPVFLARNAWHLERTQKDWPKIRFLKTVEPGPR